MFAVTPTEMGARLRGSGWCETSCGKRSQLSSCVIARVHKIVKYPPLHWEWRSKPKMGRSTRARNGGSVLLTHRYYLRPLIIATILRSSNEMISLNAEGGLQGRVRSTPVTSRRPCGQHCTARDPKGDLLLHGPEGVYSCSCPIGYIQRILVLPHRSIGCSKVQGCQSQ